MFQGKNKGLNICASLLCFVALFFLILTFSIGLPIYCRPFYYAHIEPMNLVERSGFTADEIKQAFDSMMNYLTLPGKEFSTGVMRFSEEGVAHFVDCKWLFDLNAIVLLVSAVILIVLLILRKSGKVGSLRLGKRSAAFYSGLTAITLPIVIGVLASIDFTQFFKVFHYVLFPGKTNWMFNPYTDEIIKVLPQEYFMNCAILIGVSLLVLSCICLIFEFVRSKKYADERG